MKFMLFLCVAASYAQSTIPKSILEVTKIVQPGVDPNFQNTGAVEFLAHVPIIAVAVTEGRGVRWNRQCESPIKSGQTFTVGGSDIVAVVTLRQGNYGDQTLVGPLGTAYRAQLAEFRRWQTVMKSYSTDSDTFVDQLDKALSAESTPMPDSNTPNDELGRI